MFFVNHNHSTVVSKRCETCPTMMRRVDKRRRWCDVCIHTRRSSATAIRNRKVQAQSQSERETLELCAELDRRFSFYPENYYRA